MREIKVKLLEEIEDIAALEVGDIVLYRDDIDRLAYVAYAGSDENKIKLIKCNDGMELTKIAIDKELLCINSRNDGVLGITSCIPYGRHILEYLEHEILIPSDKEYEEMRKIFTKGLDFLMESVVEND